ncbi:MAG: diversity-generating retroelement protein Avd [Armatimonadetes bacterium]|nr:diversity-generating retroelement protein Avd [Armatimonadota bacterium]
MRSVRAREPRSKEAPPELIVITRAYDLVRELTQRVVKFPRDFRFVLGDRILNNVYDLLDLLIEARYTRQKESALQRANLRLEQLRFQVRFAYDERFLSHSQYGSLCERVDEVGRLIGGWRRSRLERSHRLRPRLPERSPVTEEPPPGRRRPPTRLPPRYPSARTRLTDLLGLRPFTSAPFPPPGALRGHEDAALGPA